MDFETTLYLGQFFFWIVFIVTIKIGSGLRK